MTLGACTLVAVAAVLLWTAPSAPNPVPPPLRTTPDGEVLPPFARTRLGPAPPPRLWGDLRLTPDGRSALVGHGEWDVATVDLATRTAKPMLAVEPWRAGQRKIRRHLSFGPWIDVADEDAAAQPVASAWSADGSRFAVGVARTFRTRQASTCELRVYDVATGGMLVRDVISDAHAIYDVALSPDGTIAAVAWDARGRPAASSWVAGWRRVDAADTLHETPGGQFTGVAVAPDATAFATLGASLVVHEIPRGTRRFSTPAADASLSAVAWSPDGRTIAHAEGSGGDVVLRDAADGGELWRHAGPSQYAWPTSIVFSADGARVVVCAWGGQTTVLDTATGAVLHSRSLVGTSAAFTLDGRRLVVASDVVRVFDATTWAEIDAPPRPGLRPHATALVLAADASWVVTGDLAGNIRLWDGESGALRASVRPVESKVTDLAASGDSSTVAALHADGTLVLLDAATLVERSRASVSPRASITYRGSALIRLEPGAESALVEVDHATGAQTVQGTIGSQEWARADISDDGAFALVRGSQGSSLVALARDRGGAVVSPRARDGLADMTVNWASYSADGRFVLVQGVGQRGSAFSGLRLVDLARGATLFEVEPDLAGTVDALAVSPRGDLIAWSSYDAVVELWHVPSQDRAARFVGTRSHVTKLRFSGDGSTLAAADGVGSVILWDVSGFR